MCVCAVALSCPTLCEPMGCAHQASLSMGFSRQESWSGLPFPSPAVYGVLIKPSPWRTGWDVLSETKEQDHPLVCPDQARPGLGSPVGSRSPRGPLEMGRLAQGCRELPGRGGGGLGLAFPAPPPSHAQGPSDAPTQEGGYAQEWREHEGRHRLWFCATN